MAGGYIALMAGLHQAAGPRPHCNVPFDPTLLPDSAKRAPASQIMHHFIALTPFMPYNTLPPVPLGKYPLYLYMYWLHGATRRRCRANPALRSPHRRPAPMCVGVGRNEDAASNACGQRSADADVRCAHAARTHAAAAAPAGISRSGPRTAALL
ncbi:hypothetical protein B0H14DRAFT_3490385 [Mycena olivaceomarginata]|nr:hypothetical protein B0H14DRAFT_3490385 [Mycena olivaceomarginata]